MIPFDWILELVLGLAVSIAMLVSLIAYFVEKAIQLVLIIMAYVFGPFFIVMLVSPDTERYTSDFLKMFGEATCWNFIWSGLVTIMIYLIQSGTQTNSPIYMLTNNVTLPVTSNPQNPWFVLLLMLGIMQAMLQVPGYLSRGGVSAKFGILELGFAAYQAKRALGMLYGTHGLYTQLRHAIRDPNSHRWPLNLPNVKAADAAKYSGQVSAGDAYGQKAFAGLASGTALGSGLTAGGASSSLLSAQTSASQALTAAQLQGARLAPAQLAAIGPGAGLTPTQTAALSSAQAALSQAQAAAHSQAQAAALNQAQIASSLNRPQTAALNQGQLGALGALGATALPSAAASMPDAMNKIPVRAGLPLMGDQRVTGRQTHTNLATWLAQKVRLEGGVTFKEYEKGEKHPGVGFSKTGITFDQIGGPDSFSVPTGASKEQRALALAATSFAGGPRRSRQHGSWF